MGTEWEVADHVQGPDSVYPQGLPASYYCWLELPGELQRLPASLEETTGDAGLVYCQAQQVSSHPQLRLPLDAFCSPQMPQTPFLPACPSPSEAHAPHPFVTRPALCSRNTVPTATAPGLLSGGRCGH